MAQTTAAGRYEQLSCARSSYLDRARDCSKLTIPTLVPPDGAGPATKYYTPYQGIGAQGVNNLASKLLLALFPPNQPFFRFLVDDFTMEKVTQQEGMRGEVEKALNRVKRAIETQIEANAIRVTAFEALKQLVVSGNVLCYLPTEGGMRAFRLDRFVVHRDPMGNVLEIITQEEVALDALPEEVQAHLRAEQKPTDKQDPNATVRLYTWVRRDTNLWQVHQEVHGMMVPGTKGSYPLDKSPWIPLRWTKMDCEDYGRGYVEEYYGDLKSLEALTKAIVQGSAAAAKVLFLVNPNGTTRLDTLSKSESGDVRAGVATDVSVLQLDKQADFQVALKTMETIQQRLAMAFMMNTAIQRNGERVTAEEIRYMAGQLEDALGGVYSILSQEFQYPLVTRIQFQMERQGKLPPLPKELVRPTITTGLEALGRGHDLDRLDTFMSGLAQMFGPEALANTINLPEYLTRRGTALGIDMNGLVKDAEEQAQQSQQAQMMALVQKLGPKGMDIIRDQMNAAGNNAPQISADPGASGAPAGAGPAAP